jgi:hypothetical protein
MKRRVPSLTFAVAVVAFAACNEGPGSPDPVFCEAIISSALQSGATLVATGNFSGGQPIVSLGQTITIPASNYTESSASFDLTGVPPGTYNVTWSVSCDENAGKGPIDGSKVKSITIH